MNFNLRKEKLLFHYSLLLCLGFKDVPIFYNPPVWLFGLQNVDPPPLPAWDKSNGHKLNEPLKEDCFEHFFVGRMVCAMIQKESVSLSFLENLGHNLISEKVNVYLMYTYLASSHWGFSGPM